MRISEKIKSMKPYIPGKPIEEVQREYGLKEVYKLASNENGLGASPKVIQAVTNALRESFRYPDPSCYQARKSLGKYWNIDFEKIVLGNGSNELIDLLIRLYCEPGDDILTSQAAFVAYKVCASVSRVNTIEVPLDSQLKFDLSQMLEVYKKAQVKPKLVFLANPNNPTGSYLNISELKEFISSIEKLAAGETKVVLDEAYFEFVRAKDYANGLKLLKEFEQTLVVIRTFSKAYGLAGFRIGALVADSETVSLINKIRNPFNVNSLAQVALVAAISDSKYIAESQKLTWDGLVGFYKIFSELNLKYWPSQGNFVLFDCGQDAATICEALLKKGVIVRPVASYGWPKKIRLSVGSPEENNQAIKALTEVINSK